MRYLPVFLDLQSGKVLLVGAGELVRAKLRLLVSAGARVRWYAIDGNHDRAGLDTTDAARIEQASGDPLADDLSDVIAVLCASSSSRWSIEGGGSCPFARFFGTDDASRKAAGRNP